MPATMPRIAAVLVALVCWAGLAIQFSATYASTHSVAVTTWILLRYFTVITNFAVALCMTWFATGGRLSARLLGGLTLAILLVGVVYMTLLRGLVHLSGGAELADTLLHKVSPVLMALWWLLFAPRGQLKWPVPLVWCIYPLAYFAYVLARAHVDGKYPYPFMDVGHLGWVQTVLNAAGIALGFIICGAVLVWIDSWRPLGSRSGRR